MNRNSFLRNTFFVMILLSLVLALTACTAKRSEGFVSEQSRGASDFDVKIEGDPCPSVCYQGTIYCDTGKFYTELPEGYVYVGETTDVSIGSDLGEMESWGGGALYAASTPDTVIMAYAGDLYDDGLPRYVVYIRSDLK